MFVFSCVRLTVPGPHCNSNNSPPPSCISINPEVLVGIGHLKKVRSLVACVWAAAFFGRWQIGWKGQKEQKEQDPLLPTGAQCHFHKPRRGGRKMCFFARINLRISREL